jgi:hypothetical protein
VKPRKLNAGLDHLSRILSREDEGNQDENLSDAQLFSVKMVDDYFADIVQFLSMGRAPSDMIVAQKKQRTTNSLQGIYTSLVQIEY